MRISVLLLIFVLQGCTEPSGSRVDVHLVSCYHKKIYLDPITMFGERSSHLDSAYIERGIDSVTFHIPAGEEQPYVLKIAGTGEQVVFINDTRDIRIDYNYATRRSSFLYSPASIALKQLRDAQYATAQQTRGASRDVVFQKVREMNDRYRQFADTTRSPGAFLIVYDNVDFGDDRAAQKKFVQASAARFPRSGLVQKLCRNTLDYLAIFEHPYHVGDTLPELELPDRDGLVYSTATARGRYLLIDFWSTWCPQCSAYLDTDKVLFDKLPPEKFQIVSVAVDDQKEVWEQQVRNLPWPQLIDVGMWNGKAVKTLRFDSIPFNFIVSPDGRIVQKAVRPDSLFSVLSKLIL